jgi:hypothetical protein
MRSRRYHYHGQVNVGDKFILSPEYGKRGSAQIVEIVAKGRDEYGLMCVAVRYPDGQMVWEYVGAVKGRILGRAHG